LAHPKLDAGSGLLHAIGYSGSAGWKHNLPFMIEALHFKLFDHGH
jgi:hypothetical protein